MQTAEFKREVEKHLTGKETELWELLYFKVYKSQLAVIEQALETAELMLVGCWNVTMEGLAKRRSMLTTHRRFRRRVAFLTRALTG